jgi:hypothetical protein
MGSISRYRWMLRDPINLSPASSEILIHKSPLISCHS